MPGQGRGGDRAMRHLSLDSPVGPLTVWADAGGIRRLDWQANADSADPGAALVAARDQLCEYFAGARRDFDLPLAPGGGDFQRRFYAALCAIPFGVTRTYGDLARELGVPAQAIGQACGANPIPILIPCHRVLGANGLGGFSGAGGIEAKVALLRLEGAGSLLL